MALSPSLQAIFDAIFSAHPERLTLDELSDEIWNKPLSYGEIDALIGALEAAGVDLEAPEPAARPEELVRVLAAARELTARTGNRPSAEEIARHTGLTPAAVRRSLQFGRSGST